MEMAFARAASKSRSDLWATEILDSALFLGNKINAMALDMFPVFEVSAVVNAAPQDVKTGPDFYPPNVEYLELPDLEDDEDETISHHFEVLHDPYSIHHSNQFVNMRFYFTFSG
jgi:hypothetical protein